MTKEEIIKQIKAACSGNYSRWYIGITNDLQRRKREHNKNDFFEDHIFCSWKANSKEIAEEVEKWGKAQYMQGDTGGGREESIYVYIFERG
jgi:hypothetical protein